MTEIHRHPPIWRESRFQHYLGLGRRVITAELAVPATVDHDRILERARELQHPNVIAVNITDGLRGRPALSPVAAAAILTHAGLRVEPIVQVAARQRARNAIIGDLLGACALGVRNLLCMTGDVPQGSADVRDIDVFELIRLARGFPEGLGTEILGSAEQFFVGATWSPFGPDPNEELDRLEEKCLAGAQFIQTQPVFDAGEFIAIGDRLAAAALAVPIIVGLAPIRSAQHARRLAAIPGIHVPERLFALLDGAKDDAEAAARFWSFLPGEIARLAELPYVRGFHLTPVGHSRRGIMGMSTFELLYASAAPFVGADPEPDRAAG
jgi:5,10-methylenetetrahydrofolate reductase